MDAYRAAVENVREARQALAMIREALEEHCPPGSVKNSEYMEPPFMDEAFALVKAIDVLASANQK